MKLHINCKNCRQNFPVNSSAVTRGDLEDELGRYFTRQCSICISTNEYHVNNIRADVDKRKLLAVGLIIAIIGILVTLLFWDAGIIVTLTVVLPIIAFSYYYNSKSTAANQFNRMMIKRDK